MPRTTPGEPLLLTTFLTTSAAFPKTAAAFIALPEDASYLFPTASASFPAAAFFALYVASVIVAASYAFPRRSG